MSADETEYIQSLVTRHAPVQFLEIGMASGISGGLIATILDEHGGKLFCSIDHDNTFFGDSSKENGFLIDQIYQGGNVQVEKIPFKTSLDLEDMNRTFDMAFIDANHQHPWPTIDTLCLFPYLGGDKVVIHHDLNLYKKQKEVFGIGPKYLYDQFPDSMRDRAKANGGNIFSLNLSMDREDLEEIASNALLLPWSLRNSLSHKYIAAIRTSLSKHYSPSLLAVFDTATKRFN